MAHKTNQYLSQKTGEKDLLNIAIPLRLVFLDFLVMFGKSTTAGTWASATSMGTARFMV
jgi:hypothetical protein